jgi:hypothetical protein
VAEHYEKELGILVGLFKNSGERAAAKQKLLPLMETAVALVHKNSIELT